MDKAAVSVIVPIYNVENYLEACLSSLERQTLHSIEIILVDDGSTDGSRAIAQKFTIKNDNWILIDRKNGGLSAARNSGLALASGEYVYFLDSDDFLADNALEVLYKKSLQDNLDVLKFSAYTFGDGSAEYQWTSKDGYKYKGIYPGIYSGLDVLDLFFKNGDIFPSCCLIFTKRALIVQNRLQFYEGIIHEDELFHYQLLAFANQVGILNEPLYYRRIRPGSITQTPNRVKASWSLCIIAEELDGFLNNHSQLKDSPIHWQIMICINNVLCKLNEMTIEEYFSKQTSECFSKLKPLLKKYAGESKTMKLFSISPVLYRACTWSMNTLRRLLQ